MSTFTALPDRAETGTATGMGHLVEPDTIDVSHGAILYLEDVTVEENLLIGAAAKRAPSKVPDSIYELFPVLKEMKGRRGGDLSGGQQQQLAIGRALMSEPRLLILDEPTEGIQPSIIQEIGRTLRRLVDEFGMSVLLVEQYYDFARSIADRYVVMSRGEVIAHGDGANMEADGVRDLVAV